MLTATNIEKRICDRHNSTDILYGVSLEVTPGEIVAIMGPSGCGKSTLLGILAGMDTPTSGQVFMNDQDIYSLSEAKRNAFRNQHMGIIFQSHNLINELNCIDNISIPWVFSKETGQKVRRNRVREVLDLVGLESKQKLYPHQLSGGEQQRASVARAMLMHPQILFADEPTGSLDQGNSSILLRIFRESVTESGHSIVLVTHDANVAAACDRIIKMRDGRFTGEETK